MRDNTTAYLSEGRRLIEAPTYDAYEAVPTEEAIEARTSDADRMFGTKPEFARHFLGKRNLGVSGNSNRAIHWFMTETDADHLCLCNDDIHVLADFVAAYRNAHSDLGVGMWCFTDFTHHPSYKWVPIRKLGYSIKLMPRITGIMISVTRALVEKIGYFDMRFGQFGNEHVDYTHRARFAGGICLDGQAQNCLDIDPSPPVIKHQDVETSLTGKARVIADREAEEIMNEVSAGYATRHYYRPFSLSSTKFAATHSKMHGIPIIELPHYTVVNA